MDLRYYKFYFIGYDQFPEKVRALHDLPIIISNDPVPIRTVSSWFRQEKTCNRFEARNLFNSKLNAISGLFRNKERYICR